MRYGDGAEHTDGRTSCRSFKFILRRHANRKSFETCKSVVFRTSLTSGGHFSSNPQTINNSFAMKRQLLQGLQFRRSTLLFGNASGTLLAWREREREERERERERGGRRLSPFLRPPRTHRESGHAQRHAQNLAFNTVSPNTHYMQPGAAATAWPHACPK